jgi:hypothetical protein
LNVHRVSDIKQIEILIAEQLVSDPSPCEAEIAIVKLIRYKSTGSDKLLAEVIQAGDKKLLSEVHKLIDSVWNMEELPDQCKESVIYKTSSINLISYNGISLLSPSYKIVSNILLSQSCGPPQPATRLALFYFTYSHSFGSGCLKCV